MVISIQRTEMFSTTNKRNSFFLGTQVALGALTVTRQLDPTTVNLHLLNATLLLGLSCTILVLTNWKTKSKIPKDFSLRNFLFPETAVLLFLVLFTLFQLVMGGRVSSHYAGLACPDFPTCYGVWFPEMLGSIRFQMEHRWIGYSLAISIFFGTFFYIKYFDNIDTKKFLILSSFLVVVQIFIGGMNVWFKLPKLLTGLHSICGITIFISLYFAFIYQLFFPHHKKVEL